MKTFAQRKCVYWLAFFFQPADEIAAIAGDSVEEEVLEVSGIVEQDAALELGAPIEVFIAIAQNTTGLLCLKLNRMEHAPLKEITPTIFGVNRS